MLRGFHTAAAGMISQQRRQEMLTNNMANAQTPGYKSDQSALRAFPEMLLHRIGASNDPNQRYRIHSEIGSLNTGVYMQETIPNFVQGSLEDTGNSTDVALINGNLPTDPETGLPGAIFFAIRNEEGDIRYTRNGNFTVDVNGNLVTNDGRFVLNTDDEPIQITDNDFTVNENGQVLQNGIATDRINVAFSENPGNLVKEGSGLFRLEGDGPLPSAYNNENLSFQIKQGFLERSNVDINQTMTEMLTAYRSFEANQKVLQAYDRSLEKTVNEIGSIR